MTAGQARAARTAARPPGCPPAVGLCCSPESLPRVPELQDKSLNIRAAHSTLEDALHGLSDDDASPAQPPLPSLPLEGATFLPVGAPRRS